AAIGMGADPVAILATSVMAAPASLYVGKILVPETGRPETLGDVQTRDERPHANVIDAAAAGASEGMRLAINIAAMLIAFIAFIALFNYLLALIQPELYRLAVNYDADAGTFKVLPVLTNRALSLQMIFAKLFAPVAVLIGVQGVDAPKLGELLGIKLVLNEFVAYTDLKAHYQPWMEGGLSK